MADVVLSHLARADLVEIGEFGEEQFGRQAADAYLQDIARAFDRLGNFPHSGEAKTTWGRGFRCLICNRHRIVHRVSGSTVEIVRILHHSRDVPRHLPE